MMGWHHSQMTQSLGAYTRLTNWQAVTPPRESPPGNVRTPVKSILARFHALSLLMYSRMCQNYQVLNRRGITTCLRGVRVC
jgi:hypothetical protein